MISILAFFVGSYSPVPLPAASDWQVMSDKTERGGESIGRVEDTASGIRFAGSLGSIPGRDGKPVGFALARIQYSAKGRGLSVDLKSDFDQTVLLLIAPPLSDPAVTYQYEIHAKANTSVRYRVAWRAFHPTVRGRPAPSAPKLDPALVTSFAIEITRGSQPGSARYEPIDFGIELQRF